MVTVAAVATVAGDAKWWTLLILLPAGVGAALGHVVGRHGVSESTPSERLLAYVVSSVEGSHGRHEVNIPGVLEGLGAIGIVVVGPWLMDADGPLGWRLVALAAGAAFATSMFYNAFVDPAFYTVYDPEPILLRLLRAWCGPIMAVLMVGICIFAPWPAGSLPIVGLLCMATMVASSRIHETDRIVCVAAREGDVEKNAGRSETVRSLHSLMTLPLNQAREELAQFKHQVPHAYDAIRIARSQLDEFGALEDTGHWDVDWPGSLVGPLRRMTRVYGFLPKFNINLGPLYGDDRNVTRIVMNDLVTNALDARARNVSVTLESAANCLVISVDDDGRPFPPDTWCAPGTSLARLERMLRARHGSLSLKDHPSGPGKRVRAMWERLEDRHTGGGRIS
jgi:hypothetical protein